MIELFTRAVPPFVSALPLALALGAIVGIVTWLAWRQTRLSLQRTLVSVVFGGAVGYGIFPFITGLSYVALGRTHAGADPLPYVVALIVAMTAVVVAVLVGRFVARSRLQLALLLIATAYAVTLLFFTYPAALLRGG